MSSFAKEAQLGSFLRCYSSGGKPLQTFLITEVMNLYPSNPSVNKDITSPRDYSVKIDRLCLLKGLVRSVGIG